MAPIVGGAVFGREKLLKLCEFPETEGWRSETRKCAEFKGNQEELAR